MQFYHKSRDKIRVNSRSVSALFFYSTLGTLNRNNFITIKKNEDFTIIIKIIVTAMEPHIYLP